VDAYKKYKDQGYTPKAFCLINPGNPTGNIFSKENLVDIVKFSYDNNLIIISDEVYQNNIYSPTLRFHSMRKIASEMKSPYNQVSIFSLNSTSKGYYGE
jgi:alanine transaminase